MTAPALPLPEEQAQPQVAALVPQDLFEGLIPGGQFPTTNLLPEAIKARREVARAKRKALIMVAAVLGLLISMLLITFAQQKSADAAKAQAQETMDAALLQKQKYSYVPAVYLAVSNARQELGTAMGQEVQVSHLMSGLVAMQPQGVSLVTWDAVVVAGQSADMQPSQTVVPGAGTVEFSGESTTVEGIAAWLERVKTDPNYANPVLGEVGTGSDGLKTFEASAELTQQALSRRYAEEAK